jgi:hypothetical protein
VITKVESLPGGYRLDIYTNRTDLRDPLGQMLGFGFDRYMSDGSWAIGIWTRESRAVASRDVAEQELRDYAAELARQISAGVRA